MIGETRYLILWRILESAGGIPLPGDLETDLLEKYLIIIGGTPVPGDTFYNLLVKIVDIKGGTPAPGDKEWDLLVKWLVAEGECRACGDATHDLWRRILAALSFPSVQEIRVQQGAVGIVSGQGGAINFGNIAEGESPVNIVFTVFNDGDFDLLLGAVSVPTGYTLTEPLSGTITPGNSDSFTVRLDNTTLGVKAGNISFLTNDATENPFYFPVTGTVQSTMLTSMVSHWALDENDGALRLDSHGSNDLTDVNMVTRAAPVVSNLVFSAHFDSAIESSLQTSASASTLSVGQHDPFSIGGWVKFRLNSSEELDLTGLVGKWSAVGFFDYLVFFDGVNLRFHVSNNGSSNISVVAPGIIVADVPYLVMAWHDPVADNIAIQINNGAITTTAHATGVNSVPGAAFHVGRNFEGFVFHTGELDTWSFWSRLLTPAERTTYFNAGAGRAYPFS